jgi:hypothetical protein
MSPGRSALEQSPASAATPGQSFGRSPARQAGQGGPRYANVQPPSNSATPQWGRSGGFAPRSTQNAAPRSAPGYSPGVAAAPGAVRGNFSGMPARSAAPQSPASFGSQRFNGNGGQMSRSSGSPGMTSGPRGGGQAFSRGR